jgi:hypothetical protein
VVVNVNIHTLQLELASVILDLQDQVPIVIEIRMRVVRPYAEPLLEAHVDASLELSKRQKYVVEHPIVLGRRVEHLLVVTLVP